MRYGNEHESPWEGAAKWVRVRDRDDVGKVVMPGKNVGLEYCYAVLFEITGEVRFYRQQDCIRCDASGGTHPTSA